MTSRKKKAKKIFPDLGGSKGMRKPGTTSMITIFTRRRFLKSACLCGPVLGSGIAVLGTSGSSFAQFRKQSIPYTYPDGSSNYVKSGLKMVMDLVAQRFTDERAYNYSKRTFKRASFTAESFEKSNLPNTNDQRVAFFYAQLKALDVWGFPNVHFSTYTEDNEYWANVSGEDVGGVETIFGSNENGKTYLVKGEFKININLHKFNDDTTNAQWAGVIAHEMMHCLGHKHGKDEYGTHLEINAFQQGVTGARLPAFRCGRM